MYFKWLTNFNTATNSVLKLWQRQWITLTLNFKLTPKNTYKRQALEIQYIVSVHREELPWFRPSQFSEIPLTTQPCISDDNMADQHCDNGDDRIATQYIAAFFCWFLYFKLINDVFGHLMNASHLLVSFPCYLPSFSVLKQMLLRSCLFYFKFHFVVFVIWSTDFCEWQLPTLRKAERHSPEGHCLEK